nr:MAG TPA: hypothetical protein [Herelleviridae sp.]
MITILITFCFTIKSKKPESLDFKGFFGLLFKQVRGIEPP